MWTKSSSAVITQTDLPFKRGHWFTLDIFKIEAIKEGTIWDIANTLVYIQADEANEAFEASLNFRTISKKKRWTWLWPLEK